MRRITKYAVALGAILIAFEIGRSQSFPTWQVVNKDVLPDGVNIMETRNAITGDAYVITWTTSGIAIVPKSATPPPPSSPILPPVPGGQDFVRK
jgi:hypothetical protein